MPKTTDELYSELTQAQSLKEFQQRNKNEARPPQAMEYLQALLEARGMKPSQATSKAQIDDCSMICTSSCSLPDNPICHICKISVNILTLAPAHIII